MAHFESGDGGLGLNIVLEGMRQVIELWGGVPIHGGRVVGVCEDDLLCQPANVHILKPPHQFPATHQPRNA